ncbi:hypothetical protein [Pseudomonas phage K4]|uniref:hypothetical protein n=1 Tax=Pseudomonas phage O4 TaxID=1784982 RepID=UPI00078DF584|nr:hypothetical protein BJD45_gp41 [Pseudomonas phage O4]AMO43516.1 hypothetical protein O4_41 [Pseudomonas phage O4]ATG86276.1 hypothetical protein [Pseudomonas phage IME180]QWS69987.1 hypothetical protein [Pseudomonas phage K4]
MAKQMGLSERDIELLTAYENGELEYWGSGNYDDCFEMGIEVGLALAVRQFEKEENQN